MTMNNNLFPYALLFEGVLVNETFKLKFCGICYKLC